LPSENRVFDIHATQVYVLILTVLGPERRDRRMDENDGIVEAANLKPHDAEMGNEKVDRVDSNADSDEKPKEEKTEHATV
jgi:hypothetical protein